MTEIVFEGSPLARYAAKEGVPFKANLVDDPWTPDARARLSSLLSSGDDADGSADDSDASRPDLPAPAPLSDFDQLAEEAGDLARSQCQRPAPREALLHARGACLCCALVVCCLAGALALGLAAAAVACALALAAAWCATRAARRAAVSTMRSLFRALRDLDRATGRALIELQEIELVARGYRVATPLSPITRLEQASRTRRGARVRRAIESTLRGPLTWLAPLACTDPVGVPAIEGDYSGEFPPTIRELRELSSLCRERRAELLGKALQEPRSTWVRVWWNARLALRQALGQKASLVSAMAPAPALSFWPVLASVVRVAKPPAERLSDTAASLRDIMRTAASIASLCSETAKGAATGEDLCKSLGMLSDTKR
eukprot:m51a1_g780 hypothetical protein (373) ;mRNA; r:616295-617635